MTDDAPGSEETRARPAKRKRPPRDGFGVMDLCAALGISKETFRQWHAKGWTVRSPSGAYYDVEATKARADLLKSTHGGKPRNPPNLSETETAIRQRQAELRKAEADAETAELKAAHLRGSLVSLIDARQVLTDAVTLARSTLEALPIRLCDRLAGLEATAIRAAIAHEVEAVLLELSRVRINPEPESDTEG